MITPRQLVSLIAAGFWLDEANDERVRLRFGDLGCGVELRPRGEVAVSLLCWWPLAAKLPAAAPVWIEGGLEPRGHWTITGQADDETAGAMRGLVEEAMAC